MLYEDVSWSDLWSAGLLDRSTLAHARAAGLTPASWLLQRLDAQPDVIASVRAARCADETAARRARLPATHVLDVARHWPDAATDSPFLVVAGGAPLRLPGALAIVGTRRLDGSARRLAEELVESICAALPLRVVSGGALGVDAIAQRAALRHGREMVVVLAGGLAHAGPAPHRDEYRAIVDAGGLLVTERPIRAEPQQFEFVRRNRLIAWIADATLVVRAPATSGALITARWATRLGRPVLAVPGEPRDPLAAGCHDLMRAGARICTDVADVASALGLGRQLQLPGVTQVESSPSDALACPDDPLLHAFRGESCTADVLSRRLTWPVARVMGGILEAELLGTIEPDGPGRWRVRPGFAAARATPMLRP